MPRSKKRKSKGANASAPAHAAATASVVPAKNALSPEVLALVAAHLGVEGGQLGVEDGQLVVRDAPGTDLIVRPKGEVDPVRSERAKAAQREWVRKKEVRDAIKRRRIPHQAAGLTAAAGLAGWGVQSAATALGGSFAGTIAVVSTTAVTAGAAGVVRYIKREKIPKVWKRRSALAAGSSILWILTVSIAGYTWFLVAVLMVADVAYGARWWREQRIPTTKAQKTLTAQASSDGDNATYTADTASETPEPTVEELQVYAERWARKVARNSSKGIKDALLTDGRVDECALTWTVEFGGGETLRDAQNKLPNIASLMKLSAANLMFDDRPVPAGEQGDDSKIRMQIVTKSPVAENVDYQVPVAVDGFVDVGLYADGRGNAMAVVLSDDGVKHTAIVASSGYGKSSFIDGFACAIRRNWPTVTLHMDPKRNSSPDLARNATLSVPGVEEAEQFTRAVELIIEGRGLKFGSKGEKGFTPTKEDPLYLIVIDECDVMFAIAGMGARWGFIAKTGRALGVKLVLATQMGDFKAWGNNEMLRSNATIGNLVFLRTNSNSSDQLIGGNTELPPSRTLPYGVPGWAYIKNERARRAPLRFGYLPDEDGVKRGTKPAHSGGLTANSALRQHPDVEMDVIGQVALKRAGFELGVTPEERAEMNKEEMKRRFEQFLDGEIIKPPAVVQQQSPFAPVPVSEVPAPLGARKPTFDDLLADLSEREGDVLRAIMSGARQAKDIAAASAISGPRASETCKALVARNVLHSPKFGTYELTETVVGLMNAAAAS